MNLSISLLVIHPSYIDFSLSKSNNFREVLLQSFTHLKIRHFCNRKEFRDQERTFEEDFKRSYTQFTASDNNNSSTECKCYGEELKKINWDNFCEDCRRRSTTIQTYRADITGKMKEVIVMN